MKASLAHNVTKRKGLSVLELILVVAMASILAAISAPLYVGWRADSLNAEAARFVERSIAIARADAKRRAVDVTLVYSNDATLIPTVNGAAPIPNGGRIVVPADRTVSFDGAFGAQTPFGLVEIGVRTGTGAFERTATVTLIPPLGKTAVSR